MTINRNPPSSLTNASWNGAGTSVEMITGLLLAPFLIHSLGADLYGVWVVIGSLTSYFASLDLGIRLSVGRFIAYHSAADDREAVNRVLMSSIMVLSGLAVVAGIGAAVLATVLHRLLALPSGSEADASSALVIVGINVGFSLLANAFDAGLWAHRRFDLLNIVDMPVTIARALLSVAAVLAGFGLLGLALVTLLTTVVAGAAKLIMVRRIAPYIRFGVRSASIAGVREIMDYGIWNSARNIGILLRRTAAPILIGYTLGPASVTVFSLAARLIGYAQLAMNAGAGVLTPLATAHHARQDHTRQSRLFIGANSLCFILAGLLSSMIAILGTPFIVAWVGPAFAVAGTFAAIMIAGEFLPLSQVATEGVLQGMARHRVLAVTMLLDGVTGMAAAAALAPHFGLFGVCVGLSVSALVVRGLPVLAYGLKTVGVSVSDFLSGAVAPAAWRLTIAVSLLFLYTQVIGRAGWVNVIIAGGVAFAAIGFSSLSHPVLRRRLSW